MLILAITAHWIDKKWQLHEALLDFKRLQGQHTGLKLAQEIFDTLDQFNIAAKLFSITTDNASNNGKAMRKLSRLLLTHKGIHWNWKEHHISCLNHVINIAVQAFLRRCKALHEESYLDEPVDDASIENNSEDEDEDNESEEEEDEYEETSSLNEDISINVKDAASGFQHTMWKLREIAKVRL